MHGCIFQAGADVAWAADRLGLPEDAGPLPVDLIDKIRAKVGPGNPLRHVAETVEERRRQAALTEFLAHHERKYGPISDAEVQEELDRWDADLRRAEEGTTSRSSSTAKG